MLPRPKAYVDWTVPIDEDGNEIGLCRDDDIRFHQYLEWLTNYLYQVNIPVPETQLALLELYREKGVDHAIIDLSNRLGYSIWEMDFLENDISQGISFSELHEMSLEAWNNLSDEEKEYSTEEEFFTSEEDFERIKQELIDSEKVPSNIHHADIPYRPILAALFKNIPDFAERYQHLKLFYSNYNDCASK